MCFSRFAGFGRKSLTQWKQHWFGDDAGDPTIAGESADPDSDDIINLLEFADNLDPLLPQETEIYGNLMIVPKKPDPKMDTGLVFFGSWGVEYPVNTMLRDNVFVVEPEPSGTFIFGRAKNVRFRDNCFYGQMDEIGETDEVELHKDTFIRTIPEEVAISGSREELQQFALFQKEKGNPQEKHGIGIR